MGAGRIARVADIKSHVGASREDENKSGKAKPINGEAFLASLREREEELLEQRSPR